MYSPKIREDLIPRLYQLKVKQKRPMTHLVNEAVSLYLDQQEKEITNGNEKDRGTDPEPSANGSNP